MSDNGKLEKIEMKDYFAKAESKEDIVRLKVRFNIEKSPDQELDCYIYLTKPWALEEMRNRASTLTPFMTILLSLYVPLRLIWPVIYKYPEVASAILDGENAMIQYADNEVRLNKKKEDLMYLKINTDRWKDSSLSYCLYKSLTDEERLKLEEKYKQKGNSGTNSFQNRLIDYLEKEQTKKKLT